jgi:hypothetical protein
MAHVMEPGTSRFYVEGPLTSEEVRNAFDDVFLNCVTLIVQERNTYWVYVDMGRQCLLLEEADQKIKGKGFIVNGWKVTYG